MNNRLHQLVDRLHEKSERGELAWRKGASGAFEVSFARHTVALVQWGKDGEIALVIRYDEGELIDEITERDLVEGLQLQETYNMARRKALGSDQAIDELLRVLEK